MNHIKFTKETFRRMVRTFIQTVLGYIVVNIAMVDLTSGKDAIKTALIGLGVSAVASGIAAAMNLNTDKDLGEDIAEEK